MHFTLWPSRTAQKGDHAEISWEDFIILASNPATSEEKLSLEAWSPAKFRDNLRGKANVELLSAIALDDDSSGLSLDRVCEIWRDYAGVVHTSHSHTATTPKYRIVLQLSRDVTPEEHARLWAQMRDRALAHGQVIDEQTKDPSRIWFVPARRKGGEYDWRELSGEPIDVDHNLKFIEAHNRVLEEHAPTFAKLASPPVLVSNPPVFTSNSPLSDRRSAATRLLASAWPPLGRRHMAKLALGGALRRDGWSEPDALAFMREVYSGIESPDGGKLEVDVRASFERAGNTNLTGWKTLSTLIDPAIVQAVRNLLEFGPLERAHARLSESETAAVVQTPNRLFEWETGGLDAPLPPLEYQIDGLVTCGEVVMLAAHGNSLKTWLAFSLALSVASGRPWLGRFEVKRGRVCLIDRESGKYEVKRRLKMLGARDDLLGDRLVRCSFSGPSLTEPEAWIAIAEQKPDLVLVDSFRASALGLDENDPRADLPLQHAANFAEITKSTVLFIHHMRKGSGGDRRESLRGSTAIYAACDRIFEFGDLEKKEGGIVLSTMSSLKDGPGQRPGDVRVELSDQGLRWVETEKPKDKGPDNKTRILTILQGHPAGVQKADLLNMLKGAVTERREALSELILGGVVLEYRSEKKVFVMLNPNGSQ